MQHRDQYRRGNTPRGGRCRRARSAGEEGGLAQAALTRDVKLHVDHIEPWSLGGKSLAENLRTLCAACNFSKGARRPAPLPPGEGGERKRAG
ncbi:MAG: HNH endonuclease [Alphaproteobacteria bacterium]|nr:HNH endonuclease [Alphaproteobacteria bacterium]